MSDPVIQVEGLGKKYLIRHQSGRNFFTLRDQIIDTAKMLGRYFLRPFRKDVPQPSVEELWALRDVSLEIQAGEAVGFVGRNGAGKSTLLKLLTRITEPTTGQIIIAGNVAGILEVGTGFHPELTGRENIFLNGAIMGMGRAEINRKFDEIVAFAEVEKFLDTPVKRYSSGMYVRLAFAVAAHLEPDILIVDEVLAVGDSAFQRKCLSKMNAVTSEQGRTVLFVSHNMLSVKSLCQKAFFLEAGRIRAQGTPNDVIDEYLKSVDSIIGSDPLEHRRDRSGDGSVKIISIQVEDADGFGPITSNSRLKITLGYRSERKLLYPQFVVQICDYNSGVGLISLHSGMSGGLPDELSPKGSVTCVTEQILISPGKCFINLNLRKGNIRADAVRYAAHFEVQASDVYGTGRIPDRDLAVCLLKHQWFPTET